MAGNDRLNRRQRRFVASVLADPTIQAAAKAARISERADVLKVAHHGSGGSTTGEFLTAVDPAYVVLSVGADNRFGHPHPAVLDRLGAVQTLTTLRTDEQGTVEFVTDGARFWVQAER